MRISHKIRLAFRLLLILLLVIQLCRLYKKNDTLLERLPVFVAGFSNNHMQEGLHLLNLFMEMFGNNTFPPLIFYDLGLSENNANHIKTKYGHRIEFRTFNFSKYPSYVKSLFEYRWKPLIISECLEEFPGVWWMDSSVRFNEKFTLVFKDLIRYTDKSKLSMTLFNPLWPSIEGYSIYATTHPGLYKVFPIPIEKSKQLIIYEAGYMLIIKSERSVPIVNQWVQCALEKDCMAPPGHQLFCKFSKDGMNDYAHCHRYDQSVINILMAMNCNYDLKCYVYHGYCGIQIVGRKY